MLIASPSKATRAPVCRLLTEALGVGWTAEDMAVAKSINVVVYEAHGNPAEVLRLIPQPYPVPKNNQAVVEMRAAPINPADLNTIEGKYPGHREVPATPGMEGAGVVVAV